MATKMARELKYGDFIQTVNGPMMVLRVDIDEYLGIAAVHWDGDFCPVPDTVMIRLADPEEVRSILQH